MSSISYYISQFFAPSSKEESTLKTPKPVVQLAVEYLDTTSGVWDFSRVCELFFTYLKSFPWLSESYRLQSEKISGVFALTGSALSLPQLASDVYSWVISCGALRQATALPQTDSSRDQKVSQAAKRAFLGTTNLGNTMTQALIFFHESKLADFAKHLPVINFFFNATSLISDGVESVQELGNVSKYRQKLKSKPLSQRVQRWEGKLNLAWMKLAQATSSVGMAVIGLGTLAAGIALSTAPIASAVSLGLLTMWLTAKISSYFYNKSLQESRELSIN